MSVIALAEAGKKMSEESDRRKPDVAGPPRNADEYRMQNIARMAAEETVFATFRVLGVDVRDQDSINDVRDDLSYLRRLRSDSVNSQHERRKSTYQNAGALIVGLLLCLAGYYIGRVHGLP